MDEDGDIMSVDDIASRWNLECNFLLHFNLKTKINNICLNLIHLHKCHIYYTRLKSVIRVIRTFITILLEKISVKDVIYYKRKNGGEMCVTDVKMCLLKNLSILKSKELSNNTTNIFENRWFNFIRDFRNDERVRRSWYII